MLRCKLVKIYSDNIIRDVNIIKNELKLKGIKNIKILSIDRGWLNSNEAYKIEIAYQDNYLPKTKVKKYR